MKYINTDELKAFIDAGKYRNPCERVFSENDIIDMVNEMPAADVVEVKHGEWKTDRKEIVVRYGDEYEVHIPYCSECGWKRSNVYEYLGPGKVKWNFCPECGADMRNKNVNKK